MTPIEVTFTNVNSTVQNTDIEALVQQLHACLIHLAFSSIVFVVTPLIEGYANLSDRIALHLNV